MKVFISPEMPNGNDGIYRVISGQRTWLPKVGVEIVTDPFKADVLNVHIASFPDRFPQDIPLVVSNHGLYWTRDQEGWGSWTGRLNRTIIDAFRQADRITVPSKWVQYAIQRNFHVSPYLVYHGIDTDEWVPGENQKYILWNKARADIACDPSIVNQLAQHIPATQFISTFGQKSQNVKLIGKQSAEEMKEWVRGAGVYLATAKETGGPCFGVLEAMACGVPVVTWEDGGTAEVIRHQETGYIAKNVQDMIIGIRYCIEHRKRMSEAIRQDVVERFQWKDVIHGYVDAFTFEPQEVKTSIIITNHNLGKYVGKAIDSALVQKDVEVIVVDDASTDNSKEIIQRYEGRVKPIYLTENVHVAEARNTGIKNAKGKYILPLDADDSLPPHAVEILSKALDEDRGLSIAYGTMHVSDEKGNEFISGWPPSSVSMRQQLAHKNQLMYSSLYRKKVWEIVGGYRRRIRTGVEDADFWTRALSYNCTAKQVTTEPTLRYLIRKESLSNANKGEDWTVWFPWRKYEHLLPAGVTEFNGTGVPISAFSNPSVSVVIPVGPRHGPYLQGALDSLLAQTSSDWEAVVVNDTGGSLDYYLNGFPFVTLVDKGKLSGVAEARNEGIKAAKGKYVIFLDADDLLEPQAVDILTAAIANSCGWFYSDWLYKDNKGVLVRQDAEEWDSARIIRKSISAITAIYKRSDILHGFDQEAPGWEDWIFHLSLLEKGVCGTRVAAPLFYYNMKSGMRREENFENTSSLIQYVRHKFSDLFSRVLRGEDMCKSCGGKKATTVVTQNLNPTYSAKANLMSDDNLVALLYTGSQVQYRRIQSKTHKGKTYRIGGTNTLVYVYPEDVAWLTSTPDLVVAKDQPHSPAQEVSVKEDTSTLMPTNETLREAIPVAERDYGSLDALDLAPEILGALKKHYTYVFEVSSASDGELLAIKGIGDSRLSLIREAIKKWGG